MAVVAVHAEMRETAAGVRVCGDAAGLAREPWGASGALDSADDDEVDSVCGREGDTEGDEQKGIETIDYRGDRYDRLNCKS